MMDDAQLLPQPESAVPDRFCLRDGPLRVCFISYQYPPAVGGGIGRFTADLAQGFAAAGHEVHVVSAHRSASTVTLEDGVWVHRLADLPFLVDELRNEAAFWDLSRIASVYCEVLVTHRVRPFDIVSSPLWLAEGLLVTMDPGFVSVLSLHTGTKTAMAIDAALMQLPRARLEEHCVRFHRYTHANSAASLATVNAAYGPVNGPFVIHHGVRDRVEQFQRRRWDDGRVRILVVGRMEMRKGADVLLDILPQLLARLPNVEVVLIGHAVAIGALQGRSLPEVFRVQAPAGSDWRSRVTFAGEVSDEDLYQSYADADIFLYAGRYESFGLPIAEAMSFALPVVATKAGAVAEIVSDGENGILVEVDDRKGLVDALCGLTLDAGKRRRCGAASRRRFVSQFSTARSIPRTIAAYQAIVAEARARPLACAPSQPGLLVDNFAKIIEEVTAARGATAVLAARRFIGDAILPAKQPHVTAIITCCNYARYVTQALESVAAQTYSDFECIVVDDASSDGSIDLIEQWIASRRDPRFRLLCSRQNHGQMASFAAGLAATKGDLVAFLDADDIWFPSFLEEHVYFHLARTTGACCSDLVQIDSDGRILCGTYGNPPFLGPEPRNGALRFTVDSLTRLFEWPVHHFVGNETSHVPARHYFPYPWNATSGMTFRRSLLEIVMPRRPEKIPLCADSYLFVICHGLMGSGAIGRALGAYRRHGRNQHSYFPVTGSHLRTKIESSRHHDRLIVPALLTCLAERHAELSKTFAATTIRTLMRRLLRWSLREGIPVEWAPVYAAMGRGRALRDRARAKVPSLRKRLV